MGFDIVPIQHLAASDMNDFRSSLQTSKIYINQINIKKDILPPKSEIFRVEIHIGNIDITD